MLKIAKRLLAAAVVIAAAGAPSAAYARLNLDPPVAHVAPQPAAVTPSAPRAEASSAPGFRWDDAGIGAAGILVLIGTGAGTAVVIGRRHGHHTPVS